MNKWVAGGRRIPTIGLTAFYSSGTVNIAQSANEARRRKIATINVVRLHEITTMNVVRPRKITLKSITSMVIRTIMRSRTYAFYALAATYLQETKNVAVSQVTKRERERERTSAPGLLRKRFSTPRGLRRCRPTDSLKWSTGTG